MSNNNNNNNNNNKRHHQNRSSRINKSNSKDSLKNSRLGCCKICKDDGAIAKYKCPKCGLPYCSVKCFKLHKEQSTECSKPAQTVSDTPAQIKPEEPINSSPKSDNNSTPKTSSLIPLNPKYEECLKDQHLQYLLKQKALKFHLKNLFSLMNDPAHSREQTAEGRKEVALKKLTELRMGGLEANELVEEFCKVTTDLLNK